MELTYGLIEFGSPDYVEAVNLRHDVLRKPLGLEFSAEELAEEFANVHMGLWLENGTLASTLQWVALPNKVWKMRQVATAPEWQGKGLGKQLVQFAEAWVKIQSAQRIELHARLTAVPFYLQLGYTSQGSEFQEVGIPHFFMFKNFHP